MTYDSAVLQPSPLYKRYRFPGELISHAVWPYYRFLLSYRDVEESRSYWPSGGSR